MCAPVSDAWCASIVQKSLPWLRDLDLSPGPLEAWLRTQRNVRRLGFYFAALLEYWVRHCPYMTKEGSQILTQQQVHAGIDGHCAGQLKLVFERESAADA